MYLYACEAACQGAGAQQWLCPGMLPWSSRARVTSGASSRNQPFLQLPPVLVQEDRRLQTTAEAGNCSSVARLSHVGNKPQRAPCGISRRCTKLLNCGEEDGERVACGFYGLCFQAMQ